MMNPGWISRMLIEKHSLAAARCIVGGMAAAILGLTAGTAVAQVPIFVSHQTAPDGYTLHESIDVGGHVANIDGSGAMYDTLVNQQSGPRILGETFELRALPYTKNTLEPAGMTVPPISMSARAFQVGQKNTADSNRSDSSMVAGISSGRRRSSSNVPGLRSTHNTVWAIVLTVES